MNRAGEVARALVGRRWRWATLLVLVLMVVLARLGVWQLDRLAQRRAANAQLLAAIESAPIDLNRAAADYAAVEPAAVSTELANRDVVMRGAYDFDNQRVLKLQTWQGQAGVHLITPFILEGTDVAVLVDRGWIPDDAYAAGDMYEVDPPGATIRGYVALTETIRRRTNEAVAPASPNDELFRVDIDALADGLPYALAPFYVKENPPASEPNQPPIRSPKEIDLSEGPHLGYAMQWFIFSIGLGVAYVVFVNRSLDSSPVAHPPETVG
jgi:surfeit locus 1 family protein